MDRAVDRVYQAIQQMIVQHKIRPGVPVSEVQFAKMLGVSRTPVREALKRLEADGLIVRNARGRRYVYTLSLTDIQEIFDIKEALETRLVGWAMEKGAREHFQKLDAIAEQMLRIAESAGDSHPPEYIVRQWLNLDESFHQTLYEMAHNDRAAAIIKSLNTQWQRLKEGLVALQGRIGVSAKEHKLIARQMLIGDKAAAIEAMAQHIRNVRDSVVTILKAAGFME